MVPSVVDANTSLTTNCPLYASVATSDTLIGVSTSKPNNALSRVTVTSVVAVTPSPALILEIPIAPLLGS